MLPRLNMFGPNRDRPLIARITEPTFTGQTIPAEFAPLPALEHRPDPVGTLLGSHRKPDVKDVTAAVTNLLIELEPSEDRDSVLREWLPVAERVEAIIAAAKERHREHLRQQIAELTPQCRAALDRLRELTSEAQRLEGQLHAQEERFSTARLRLSEAEANQPDDETFPTEAELAAWRAEVQRCRTALSRVEGSRAALLEEIARNAQLRRTQQARLDELKRRRADARAELLGQPRRGPFGLQVPGEV